MDSAIFSVKSTDTDSHAANKSQYSIPTYFKFLNDFKGSRKSPHEDFGTNCLEWLVTADRTLM